MMLPAYSPQGLPGLAAYPAPPVLEFDAAGMLPDDVPDGGHAEP